jgi:GNAT superfamily N-acetyltransferase
MHVQSAQRGDIPSWLGLAGEVEPLFGPLINNPDFRHILDKNIARGSAYCVREEDGPAGVPLMGGLLWSAHPPSYTIAWLAVAFMRRRRGVGSELITYVHGLVSGPAELMVTTFGEDNAAGRPARLFYQRLGFQPMEPAANGPEGGSRQVFRRFISNLHQPA